MVRDHRFSRRRWASPESCCCRSLFGAVEAISRSRPQPTAEHEFHQQPKALALASDGPFGKFDKQQLQRGFQVYKEVCAACHWLSLVAFRDLHALGYNEAEVKAIANQWAIEVPSINPDTGEAATRKAIPSDHFPSPYANEIAARAANNNALPPDLSLMTKARHGGAAYVYSLLTGYQAQPAELLKEFPDAKTPAGALLQPLFRQPEHRDAAAADDRRPGDLCRRATQADGRPDGEGRRGVPGLDRRAEAREAPQSGIWRC